MLHDYVFYVFASFNYSFHFLKIFIDELKNDLKVNKHM